MLHALRLLSAVALTFLSTASMATVIYRTPAAFLSQVAPGAYTETFTGVSDPSASFSSGGYSYTVSAPNDMYSSGTFIGTSMPFETLTINFTSGNVTAVGGNFFAVDIGDNFQASSITLTLSDLTELTFDSTSMDDSYVGFYSAGLFITSLTMNVGEVDFQGFYASLDNLTVGTAAVVPEPGSFALAGLALAGIVATRRRNRH